MLQERPPLLPTPSEVAPSVVAIDGWAPRSILRRVLFALGHQSHRVVIEVNQSFVAYHLESLAPLVSH